MPADDKKESSDDTGFDTTRAELFDALGHPTRLRILQVLKARQLSFSVLKKEVGIESSGHLSFHLGKLKNLVKSTPSGTYELTDDGREALHLAHVMTTTTSPARAANSIEGERSKGKVFFSSRSKRRVAIVISAVAVMILLLIGIGLSNGFIFYSSTETMSWNLQPANPPAPLSGWETVVFNGTQSNDYADFSFNVGALPVAANATSQIIFFDVSIAHADTTFLDSLKLGFVSFNPNTCDCFLLEQLASLGVGGSPPVSSQMYTQNDLTTFIVQNFGYIGVATVTLGFILSLSRPYNLASYPSGNNSLVLNIDLKMHHTNRALIGQDYLGDASVFLNIMPNGLLALANTFTV